MRLNAKQELKLRDEAQVESALENWLLALDDDDPDYEHHRLEALWTYQTISTRRSPDLTLELLKSPDHRVRAAAVRVLYHWHDMASPEDLAIAANDPHPRVRREAVSALGQFDLQGAMAIEVALQVLDHPMDEYLDFALWRTCRLLEPGWLRAFQQGEINFGGKADRMAFALKAIEKPGVLGPLLETLRSPPYDPAIVRLAGKLGSAEQLLHLLEIVEQPDHGLMRSAALGLVEAAEDRDLRPARNDLNAACLSMLSSKDLDVIAAGCRLVGFWHRDELDTRVIRFLQRDDVPHSVHKAAGFALARLRHPFLSDTTELVDSAKIASASAPVPPIAGLRCQGSCSSSSP